MASPGGAFRRDRRCRGRTCFRVSRGAVTAQRERESREGRLARLGFADAVAAARDLEAIGGDHESLVNDLAQAADPDLAVRSLARLIRACGAEADELRGSLAQNMPLR